MDNFPGISVHTSLDWEYFFQYRNSELDSILKGMNHMGVDFVQANVDYNLISADLFTNYNLRIMPIAS